MDQLLKQSPTTIPTTNVKQIILSLQDFNERCGAAIELLHQTDKSLDNFVETQDALNEVLATYRSAYEIKDIEGSAFPVKEQR